MVVQGYHASIWAVKGTDCFSEASLGYLPCLKKQQQQNTLWAIKVAQQVKVFAPKLDFLSLTPGTHVVDSARTH